MASQAAVQDGSIRYSHFTDKVIALVSPQSEVYSQYRRKSQFHSRHTAVAPRGSLLSPLLFKIYVSDIPN
jgi:hypothetical protein